MGMSHPVAHRNEPLRPFPAPKQRPDRLIARLINASASKDSVGTANSAPETPLGASCPIPAAHTKRHISYVRSPSPIEKALKLPRTNDPPRIGHILDLAGVLNAVVPLQVGSDAMTLRDSRRLRSSPVRLLKFLVSRHRPSTTSNAP